MSRSHHALITLIYAHIHHHHRRQIHRALRILGVTHLAAGLRKMDSPDEEGDLENSRMEDSSAKLSKSLEYFEELITSAKEKNEVLTMAQAYRDVMKVHQVLGNDLQALEAVRYCDELFVLLGILLRVLPFANVTCFHSCFLIAIVPPCTWVLIPG